MKAHQFFSLVNAKKFLFFALLLLFLYNKPQAQHIEQSELSKVNLYLDFGGGFQRGLLSINVERRIFNVKKLTFYARAGVGGGGLDETTQGPGLLGAVTMLTGKRNHHFEVNAGTFIGKYSDVQNELFFLPIIDVGYRYQKPENSFIFSAKAGFLGIRLGLGYAF